MENERETQVLQVLKHLREHGSITASEADAKYGIKRLASRMNEIKHRGVKFDVVMESGFNRFEKKTRYARYVLIPQEVTA
jgi:hypothetical protein